jgi:hypothetical protein
MDNALPRDRRLDNIDEELVQIVFEEFKNNIDLAGVHLRDARNILPSLKPLKELAVLSKATILLACAALESNLAYLSKVAIRFAQKRPQLFVSAQVDYLYGVQEVVDERGQIVKRPIKQSLLERLEVVPSLLARAIKREYKLPVDSSPFKKLLRTIERRDAIVHPRWDKYVAHSGWWEAAEAIDAVELYLRSIASCMHPYLVGYFSLLYTIPGGDKHEVAVGHRTYGKKGPNRKIAKMEDLGIPEVLVNEWFDSLFLTHMAFEHDCEGDSPGSMLTRAALVFLYAMVDAQLAVVSQWKIHEKRDSFHRSEILFLDEVAVGVGHDGEVWVDHDEHSFKARIKAIPAILSRRIDGKEYILNLGTDWGERLLYGNKLRNAVMHSSIDEPMQRVSKEELKNATDSVIRYFDELAGNAPATFGYLSTLLANRDELLQKAPKMKR